MRELTYAQAINEALRQCMKEDERVILLGEDIGVYGGVFQVTAGLLNEFGPERVIDTPIAEAGFTGASVGAALTGMRPVVEIMFIDFTTVAMDMIINQMAKMHYMFGGRGKVPMVLRINIGAGRGTAAQHSQSFHALFMHIPGMYVAVPSTPYDAKGLMIEAIRNDNPVVFVEHKKLYVEKGDVPEEGYAIPFGQAEIKREGSDLTIVATHALVARSLNAAEEAAKEGIDVEIVDPRTLVPLDINTISASVNKTGRAIIVVQACYTGSYASHISHEITLNCFSGMKCPVRVVSSYDVPPPMAYTLENENMPNPDRIAKSIKEALKTN